MWDAHQDLHGPTTGALVVGALVVVVNVVSVAELVVVVNVVSVVVTWTSPP